MLFSVYVPQFQLSETIQGLLAAHLRDFLVVVFVFCFCFFFFLKKELNMFFVVVVFFVFFLFQRFLMSIERLYHFTHLLQVSKKFLYSLILYSFLHD